MEWGKGNGGQNGRTGLIHRRRKAMNAAISRAKKCGTAIYSTLRKNDSNIIFVKGYKVPRIFLERIWKK